MKQTVLLLETQRVKSKWYTDILAEWQPDQAYIEYLKKIINAAEYLAPIVVVKEEGVYYIVNGHHRYYAHLVSGRQQIKCILIDGTFAESEPLRKAEVLLKEFDQKTEYRYQFSGYLDRWAAAAEVQGFVNKYRPTYTLRLRNLIKKLFKKK